MGISRIGVAAALVRVSGLFLVTAVLAACGSGTNINQIWADDDGVDSLLVRARAAYDRGSFGDASKLASKALKQDPNNEHGAVIMGYISLAQGGMDTFTLIEKLIDMGSGSTSTNLNQVPERLTGDWEVDLEVMADAIQKDSMNPAPLAAATTADSNVASTLGSLSSLVDVDDTRDIPLLSTEYTDSTTYGKTFYSSYPLVTPDAVTDDLRGSVPLLAAMNQVPKYLCGFIEDAVRDADDPRDKLATCPVSTRRSGKRRGSIHLIWAFSHIAEALAFQSVVNYSTGTDTTKSNLQKRVTLYQSTTFTSASNMLGATTDLMGSVNTLFPTAATGVTQLAAMLSAMNSASQAFAAMSSSTASISGSITKAMDGLKTTASTISGATGSASQQSALKGQFSKTAVEALAAKIESDSSLTGANLTAVCTQYKALAANGTGVTTPAKCN
ncbi:MAG: hypothetical protein RIQ81_2444 [Pseudomonadota bacterium]|jgi:hypothetical protein